MKELTVEVRDQTRSLTGTLGNERLCTHECGETRGFNRMAVWTMDTVIVGSKY